MQNAGGRVEDEREESGHCERECGSFGWCGDVRRTKTRGQQKTTARGGGLQQRLEPLRIEKAYARKDEPAKRGGVRKRMKGEKTDYNCGRDSVCLVPRRHVQNNNAETVKNDSAVCVGGGITREIGEYQR